MHQIKIGEWIHADFKRVRNYAFHKRFFKLLQLGFDYWTPSGGVITPRERELVSGFVEYLCESVGREHTPALSEAAEQYLNTVATRRTRDTALLKSFEAFREWVTIQAGFYTEHIYPDGSRGRRAKSIAFANMDETEFQQVYKSVLNVLWNWILFRKFSSPEEVENVAAQLLEFA
ncbi:phage protein [Escherichia coli]|uniref:Phage protein n=1 Tax=Escherichia coli TaxID=562 RepID=A0A2X3KBK7_ECOLX|nr:phage protein [Escherichia coli]